jgi:hypothetical protein
VLDRDGKTLYVAHASKGSVSSFTYDAAAGRILHRKQTVRDSGVAGVAALALHSCGRVAVQRASGCCVGFEDCKGQLS